MADLISLLEQYGIEYRLAGQHHHVGTGWIGIDCPYCDGKGANKFHLGINLTTGSASCWRCGGVDLVKALSNITGLSMAKVMSDVRLIRRPIRNLSRTVRQLKLPFGIGELLPPHRRYLEKRGFNPDVIRQVWGVKGIGPMGGRLAWHLFVPVYHEGQMVSWVCRSISDQSKRRWISAPNECQLIPHKSLLYGEDLASHSVIVVEGPADCWRIGPGAVALFGITWTQAQLRRLVRFPRRIICFDSEKQAQHRAHQLASILCTFPGTTMVVQLDSGKDPAEANEQEVMMLRSLAG